MSLLVRGARRASAWARVLLAGLLLPVVLAGCPAAPDTEPNQSGTSAEFNNTTDPTNRGASYLGKAACGACHPTIAAAHAVHGHSQALKSIQGEAPDYPNQAANAGVPQPPAGEGWNDVAYVVGGYIRQALFVDQNGYLMTTGLLGVNTQWNLRYPPNGTAAGFVAFETSAAQPVPYDYTCFRCHTTGAAEFNPASPQFQDNRPGLAGTWREVGVQCEACHGPGSKHVPNPAARDIYIGSAASDCGRCHSRTDPNAIVASGGFIENYQQWPELLASGGHAGFTCVTCHDPHSSVAYDVANGIRNACTVCHVEQNLAFHDDTTFVRGDYQEIVGCESCHLPWAGRNAASAVAGVVGALGKMGDLRSHIFRIDPTSASSATFFDPGLTRVVKDVQGRAAVTLDFVCLRCHNGIGNAFPLTPEGAVQIAPQIHQNAAISP